MEPGCTSLTAHFRGLTALGWDFFLLISPLWSLFCALPSSEVGEPFFPCLCNIVLVFLLLQIVCGCFFWVFFFFFWVFLYLDSLVFGLLFSLFFFVLLFFFFFCCVMFCFMVTFARDCEFSWFKLQSASSNV